MHYSSSYHITTDQLRTWAEQILFWSAWWCRLLSVTAWMSKMFTSGLFYFLRWKENVTERILRELLRRHPSFKSWCGMYEGTLVSAKEAAVIAELPLSFAEILRFFFASTYMLVDIEWSLLLVANSFFIIVIIINYALHSLALICAIKFNNRLQYEHQCQWIYDLYVKSFMYRMS